MADFKHFVGSEGNKLAKLAVVAEKPAHDEVARGRPLIGTTGMMLREHLERAGIDAGDTDRMAQGVFLTNTVQNFNDPGANPSLDDVIREQPRLFKELSEMPNLTCIIALGNYALASLGNFHYTRIDKDQPRGIGQYRGSVLPTVMGIKMVPTYHPSFYVRGQSTIKSIEGEVGTHSQWRFKPVVQFDIKRAVAQSYFREIRVPDREFYVEPESHTEAIEWMRLARINARETGWLAADIENIKGANNSRYLSHISFAGNSKRGFCIPLMHVDRSPWFPEIWQEAKVRQSIQKTFNFADHEYGMIWQNGITDCTLLRKEGFVVPMRLGFDTLYAHRLLAADLPHDLGFLVSVFCEDEPYHKDESGKWEIDIPVSDTVYQIYSVKDSLLDFEVAMGVMKDLQEVICPSGEYHA